MSALTVHSIPGSPFGRAVLIALEEKGARYQFRRVAPGTLKAPAHLAIHAFGRVPVLEHGDFRLYETQAIVRYLDRVLPGPALSPTDPRALARMDQLMNVNDWYLFNGVSSVIGFQRIVGPRILGLTPDEAAIAAAMPKAHAVVDELAALLGSQRFFVGDSLTLADLMLGPQLDFLRATPEWAPLAGAHPNLAAWLARLDARPSFAATTWERVEGLARAG
jgi:glutathione S-transferase